MRRSSRSWCSAKYCAQRLRHHDRAVREVRGRALALLEHPRRELAPLLALPVEPVHGDHGRRAARGAAATANTDGPERVEVHDVVVLRSSACAVESATWVGVSRCFVWMLGRRSRRDAVVAPAGRRVVEPAVDTSRRAPCGRAGARSPRRGARCRRRSPGCPSARSSRSSRGDRSRARGRSRACAVDARASRHVALGSVRALDESPPRASHRHRRAPDRSTSSRIACAECGRRRPAGTSRPVTPSSTISGIEPEARRHDGLAARVGLVDRHRPHLVPLARQDEARRTGPRLVEGGPGRDARRSARRAFCSGVSDASSAARSGPSPAITSSTPAARRCASSSVSSPFSSESRPANRA